MKKVSKILFLSLITSVLLVSGTSNVNAASNTITIKSKNKIEHFITNYDQDFVIYKTKDKKTVYGLEFDKKILKKKQKLTFDKNADAGLLYILENGYPKSKITGDTKIDKYITQAAIWWYMDETNKGTKVNPILKNENNNEDNYGLVINYIKPLVEKAINAKNNNYQTQKATLNVNSNNNILTFSINKKYYESDYISVDLIGASKYTVSSNATILDENGEKKTKFNASEKFKVRMSVNKISNHEKITITVKATGKENIAKIYAPSNDKYQNVIGLFTKKRSLQKKFDLTVSIPTNCKYIDGNFHDKAGNITDEQTYKNECNNVCQIVNENYYNSMGEETSKLLFDKECENSCATDNEVFYGIDSRKVDKETFNKECSIVNSIKTIPTKDKSTKAKTEKEKAEKAAKAKAEKEKAEKAAKAKAEKEKAEKAAKAKAEKEKAEKAAKAKAEKEKSEKEAKAKAEKEKAEKEAKAKAEKEKNTLNNNEQTQPESTLEVDVPDTNANIPLSNILFGVLFVLMGAGLLYKRNKAIN
ncbi:MAG: Cys-Gln thioester bond-forming surface protein [Bacilli bacterium]|nr:Cys-Gln thioester bond-forming surface protein [Bacilli bacterium]